MGISPKKAPEHMSEEINNGYVEQSNRLPQEKADLEDPHKRPTSISFTSRLLGRPELTGSHGEKLVKGLRAAQDALTSIGSPAADTTESNPKTPHDIKRDYFVRYPHTKPSSSQDSHGVGVAATDASDSVLETPHDAKEGYYLRYPHAKPSSSHDSGYPSMHEVKHGESLWSIAEQLVSHEHKNDPDYKQNNRNEWNREVQARSDEIYAANKDKIEQKSRLLEEGQHLIIPKSHDK
jgi:hypothetical protein